MAQTVGMFGEISKDGEPILEIAAWKRADEFGVLHVQGRPSNKKIQKVPSYLLPLKIRKWGMESTFVPFLKIRKWELRTLPSRLKWLIARQKRNI